MMIPYIIDIFYSKVICFPGQVFLAATASLDFETKTSYQLVIEARDQGTNPAALTATTTLSVLVNGKIERYTVVEC